MFPEWSWLFAALIGSVVGSFLNMAIYRLPRRLSFMNPSKSFCPICKHPLEAIDLIPLLSWMSTGGKCRYCKAPIAVRYFFVELLTAALYSGIWYMYLIRAYDPLRAVFFSIETAGLVAVIYIDWELFIIPDELNAFLLFVAIAFRVMDHSLVAGLWGGLAGWGLLWGIAFLGRVCLGKDAMGHGDIKMMRGVGFLLGALLTTASLAMAVFLGLIFGLIFIGIASIQEKRLSKTDPEVSDANHAIGEETYVPEPIPSLLKFGVWYLLCLDIVALPFPKIYSVIGETVQEEEIDENWKPSLTTIPFGPYLAAGAIACMLFSSPIQKGVAAWWQNATGNASKSALEPMPVKIASLVCENGSRCSWTRSSEV